MGVVPLSGGNVRFLTAAVALLLTTATSSGQTTWYVDDDAPGGDGTSWNQAFTFLQDALAVAAEGDEICVGQGTYTPDRDSNNPDGTGSRSATFQLRSVIVTRGGYAGVNEPDPDERDVEQYVSVLSGDLAGNDAPDFQNYEENAYHVLVGTGVDETSVLDGFTIRSGSAFGSDDTLRGGGMFNDAGSPTVSSCRFVANRASLFGGAVYNRNGSILRFTDCTFEGNRAGTGGAILTAFDSNVNLTDCRFVANLADEGGGLYNVDSSPLLTRCSFEHHRGGSIGGAVYNLSGSSPTFVQCSFVGNSTTNDGGAIHNRFSSPLFESCVFAANHSGQKGGAVYNYGSSPQFIRCVLVGNAAELHGGAIASESASGPDLSATMLVGNLAGWYGGSMYNGSRSRANLRSSVVSGNYSALEGGAIYNGDRSDIVISNCTIVSNTSETFAGAMHNVGGSDPTMTSSISWNNVPDEIGVDGGTATVRYSDIRDGWPGPGNIDADPVFRPTREGPWTQDAVFDADTSLVVLTDSAANWVSGEHVGRVLKPYRRQNFQSLIVANTETTVTIWPDWQTVESESSGIPSGVIYAILDLHLAPESPCVNTGYGHDENLPEFDFELGPRTASCRVDMGAYESPHVPKQFADCNENTIDDDCDVYEGEREDCNQNHTPDECEEFFDCNNNGTPDECDLRQGGSHDCNTNAIPDECEIAEGTSYDCNDNSVLDECEIANGTRPDCNDNSVPDECDIANETSPDCNDNRRPDECDRADGTSSDCNGNRVSDECEFQPATRLYVDANANGRNDGTTWEDALNEVRAAYCLAQEGYGTTEIWVAAGTYTPAGPGGDRDATFQVISGLATYGGFAGGETHLSERDWELNVTILSGDLNGDDGPDFQNNEENSFHVMITSGVASSTVLDGLTITGGNASVFGRQHGAAILNISGSPTIRNSRFIRNRTWGVGGAIFSPYGSRPSFYNCTFEGNHSDSAGGVLFVEADGDVTFERCSFIGNSASTGGAVFSRGRSRMAFTDCDLIDNTANGGENHGSGGAIFDGFESVSEFSGCRFIGNTADWEGGAIYSGRAQTTVSGCEFSQNIAYAEGGAIFNEDGGFIVVRDSTVLGNVTSNGWGAGLASMNSTAEIERTRFEENESRFNGGAIFFGVGESAVSGCAFVQNHAGSRGGGIHVHHDASVTITGSSFLRNTADSGGGIFNYAAATLVSNSSFVENTASAGGGVLCYERSPSFINCTFANNACPDGTGGGIHLRFGSSPIVRNSILWGNNDAQGVSESSQISGPDAVVDYCCVQNWAEGFGGTGNTGVDPLLVDFDGGNVRLTAESSVINAGDPDFEPKPGERDLDGHARLLCDRVDMGAYEFGIGDYDCDRSIALDDYSAWADCMTAPGAGPYAEGCEAFDFDFDDDVDLEDFSGFMVAFGL